jgi:hypothetical protein
MQLKIKKIYKKGQNNFFFFVFSDAKFNFLEKIIFRDECICKYSKICWRSSNKRRE